MALLLRRIVSAVRARSATFMTKRVSARSIHTQRLQYRSNRYPMYSVNNTTTVRRAFSNNQSVTTPPDHTNSIYRILLTGGPCAGKSTALSTLKQFLMNQGFVVFTIPEAATLLQMQGGMKLSFRTLPIFQKAITSTAHALEKTYNEYALEIQPWYHGKPVVILIDRGILDGAAYITDEHEASFEQILKHALQLGPDEQVDRTRLLQSKYDMILHLVTAASGADRFYQTEQHRAESREEAIALDKRLREVYKTHPDHRIVHNISSFDDKLSTLVNYVAEKLNIANISRKPLRFLVTMKDGCIDLDRIIECLQSNTSQKQSLTVTHVTKYFLKDRDQVQQSDRKHHYTFIRETHMVDIKHGVSVYEQIQNIREQSLSLTSMHNRLEDFEHIEIPSKAGKEWADATHYMLIRNNEENGQLINESQTLTKQRYNELRKYSRDRQKQRVEKVKIFFHYKSQFYSVDVFLKPSTREGTMWLKVYRTPGNKYMPHQADLEEEKVDVPDCLEVHENVTNDAENSSFGFARS